MPCELTIVTKAIRAPHPQRHQALNMEYLQERTTTHMPDYTATVKLCVRKLAQAYRCVSTRSRTARHARGC